MILRDYQKEVDEWIKKCTSGYWPALEQLGRLAEETGEVAREINHLYGTKKKKADENKGSLGQELSDVIFTAICIANSNGIDLQNEWDKMMREKHYGRDVNRFERKE
jgi:NTP pyrophosphatase (non-canonical NTP hydrolase)